MKKIDLAREFSKEARCFECRLCFPISVGCAGPRYSCRWRRLAFSWLTVQRRACGHFQPRQAAG